MHQWPSEVFQVGVLAFPFFLEIKHNFPQCCTCRSENLTHNSSYRWSLKYFRAYDKKWHQTLESPLLTSLYANFAGGNVYIFRVDVYGCTEIKPVQSLMRCKVTWAICVILYSLQEISNGNTAAIKTAKFTLSDEKSHEQYILWDFFFPKLVCYIGLKCSEITAAMLFSIFQFSIFCKFWTLLIPSLT